MIYRRLRDLRDWFATRGNGARWRLWPWRSRPLEVRGNMSTFGEVPDPVPERGPGPCSTRATVRAVVHPAVTPREIRKQAMLTQAQMAPLMRHEPVRIPEMGAGGTAGQRSGVPRFFASSRRSPKRSGARCFHRRSRNPEAEGREEVTSRGRADCRRSVSIDWENSGNNRFAIAEEVAARQRLDGRCHDSHPYFCQQRAGRVCARAEWRCATMFAATR